MLAEKHGDTLKVGYLRKKGHVRRNWLDRWFVLTTDGLYYYKTKEVSGVCWQRGRDSHAHTGGGSALASRVCVV